VLREPGVDVRLGVSVAEATADGVRLTDGLFVSTRTLVWCVGVRPDPVVAGLSLATDRRRLVVDEYLSAPRLPPIADRAIDLVPRALDQLDSRHRHRRTATPTPPGTDGPPVGTFCPGRSGTPATR
jgi:hypothetical protein